ncbi:hypothetical protein [Halobacillus naozhouensis]|uniref:Uncharacterized protein n=1 Tax=Halobacillus naozhouensis TaxID=554880 RepID=A0ABY8IYK5_9BACI|nr:hypothetical protein [Halobacillus naozhouensis]WFT75313.1 hypothetical protein P9989_02645 [Halobacillus naozhouensis]
MDYRKMFLLYGILFSCLSVFVLFMAIVQSYSLYGFYFMLAMAITSICLSYFLPITKLKDEQMKLSQKNESYYSYFWM